jgi:hypothetical protein
VPEELKNIEQALAQITTKLEQQSRAIDELREHVHLLAKASKPILKGVEIDPDCGYEWMWLTIRLDADTWARIKSGEHIELRGRGWVPDENVKPDPNDENFYWDYWEFNGGLDKPMRVTMVSPHDDTLDLDDRTAYEGPLLRKFIRELNDL